MTFNPVGKSGEVWLKNLTDATEVYLAQGAMPALSPDGKHLLVARQRTPGKWERDREVWLLDVNSGSGRRVGIGHSPCFLPDGRGIVFFQGYTCRVFLTDMSDDKIVELESPRAFKTQPQVCLDGSGCLIRVASDGQLGEIYLLDGTQHTFAELTSLK
jgi:Tol biopolymer transport system component